MTFSQRYGYTKVRDVVQIDQLDSGTRNALWDCAFDFFSHWANPHTSHCTVYADIWTDVYEQPQESCPNDAGEAVFGETESVAAVAFKSFYRNQFLKGVWYRCFDILGVLLDDSNIERWEKQICPYYGEVMWEQYHKSVNELRGRVNDVLKSKSVGWRFVKGEFVKSISDTEIKTIEIASSQTACSVQEHIEKALHYLSDRRKPDYANTIKEAISAVESQCRIMLNDPAPTLGKALKVLKNSAPNLHPALLDAFDKLYGYTNDGNNLRHGTIDPANVDYELAQFMLVACSAFVNYLNSMTTKTS